MSETPSETPSEIPSDALTEVAAEDAHRSPSEPLARVELPAESGELLERLVRPSGSARYRLERELGRGGMGAVWRVHDPDLHRSLAMKVMLGEAGRMDGSVSPEAVSRFLEEAQVAGQLDHPGVVPVHELGVDGEGRVYFTMRLVRGRELSAIFELVAAGAEGWSLTRALGVLLRVCETMAFAHTKGVVHRDLKPSNVMVGEFGETYVMDWGLAKVLAGDADDDGGADAVRTHRTGPGARDAASTGSSTALSTEDGSIIGTVAYMSPEQARGRVGAVGRPADVYAVGAMLYQLLAGHAPYLDGGPRPSVEVLEDLLAGPPAPLDGAAPSVPAELVAICETAMARDESGRYEDMSAMAHDLRAYLENRVVRAYEAGAVAELRKWIARNRGLALASAAALVFLVVGLGSTAMVEARANERLTTAYDELDGVNRELDDRADKLALAYGELDERNRELARTNTDLVESRDRILRLSDLEVLDDLRARAKDIWPVRNERVGQLEAWMAEAQAVSERAHVHRATLAALREHAIPSAEVDRSWLHPYRMALSDASDRLARWERFRDEFDATGASPAYRRFAFERIDDLGQEVERLSARAELWYATRFREPTAQWEHDQTQRLVDAIEELERGLLPTMAARLEFAATVVERTVTGDPAAARWGEAIESIADTGACPMYRGMRIRPQVGLLPIGRDPRSGLWEFAHVASGRVPEREPDGTLVFTDDMAIVLVLIPGGSFTMGAVRPGPDAPLGLANVDPGATATEQPLRVLDIAPFFLGKFELTQGQWLAAAADNPSTLRLGTTAHVTPLYPVETVSWEDAAEVLQVQDLVYPTELQWEYAVRAGTTTPWWTGEDERTLSGTCNIADVWLTRADQSYALSLATDAVGAIVDAALWLEDGMGFTGPVGRFGPNPFGLHDMLGNVAEWCLEEYGSYQLAIEAGIDRRASTGGGFDRSVRGGSYLSTTRDVRSAARASQHALLGTPQVGVRVARGVFSHPIDWSSPNR